MNAFIATLFAVFVLASCDPREDQKALIAKLTPVYEALSEADIKTKAEANLKVLDSLFKDVTDTYTKEDLKPLATFYALMSKFLDDSVVTSWSVLDKLEEVSRKRDYVGLGVSVEVGIWNEQEYKKYQAEPVKVTKTEDELEEQVSDMNAKIQTMLQEYIDLFNKSKETAFWADYLTQVKTYLADSLISLMDDIKKESSADQRAKLLTIILHDLTDVYDKEKP